MGGVKKKRQVVIEFRACVDAGDDRELYENVTETLNELRNNLTSYAWIEKFKVYERKNPKVHEWED